MSLRETEPVRTEPVVRANDAVGVRRLLRLPARRQTAAGLAVGVLGPVAVTTLAANIAEGRPAVPALLYLVVVVLAAAIGRLWPAIVAAAVSFVCLDFFFTPPRHTFRVSKAEDLLALAVFMGVATVVSATMATVLDQRARAEFRERQVRSLYFVTSRLLSGQRLDSVLRGLAESLRALYDLAGCRILVAEGGGEMREQAVAGSLAGHPLAAVPLVAEGRQVGRIEMAGAQGQSLAQPEREVLETFAGQLALALERARLRDEADAARLEAEASRIRAALFSSVTHDLRTPLASITASASSLLEEGVPFSEEQRTELLRTILEESERLNRLVANIMDLSRLRAGVLEPELEPVPLEDLVSSVLERLRPALAGRPLTVKIREELPAVPMDVVQMDQALTNLLENAIRYAPPGSPISVTANRWHDDVEIKVADRGSGIPLAERVKVFQEFYRRDVEGRRGGSGLGLTIAQAVVAAHGGTMWIEETPGGGATIGFRLPLRSMTPAAAPDAP
jgi:two-component system, OmpR family, sensor histidine kinase KdpD